MPRIYASEYIDVLILNMSGSEYTGIVNIAGLQICQGFEYAFGSEYVRVLDIPRI